MQERMQTLRDFIIQIKANPISVSLLLYSLIGSFVMLTATFLLITQGVTDRNQILWYSIIFVGISITVIWNIAYPVHDLFFEESG